MRGSWMSMAASVALLVGCKDEDASARTRPAGGSQRTTGGPSEFAAAPPPRDPALDQAKGAQDQASSANLEAARASKDVLDLQQKLQNDDQKLGQTKQKDERKLDEAQRKEAGARDNAQAAQSDAQQKTQTAGQGSAPGAAGASQQSVTGTLSQASSDEVRVDSANHPGLLLKLNGSTRITVDGKLASPSELKEGAQVRASYSQEGDQATAITIAATSPAGGSATRSK